MIARLMVSIGAVVAAVGFSFWGIGTSTYIETDNWVQLGQILLVCGLVATFAGWRLYRHETAE